MSLFKTKSKEEEKQALLAKMEHLYNNQKKILNWHDFHLAETYFLRKNKFNPDIIIEFGKRHFAIEKDTHRYYTTPVNVEYPFVIYSLEDILEVELNQNNNVIVSSAGGGMGGAAVGGLLFGATGAIIGGANRTTSSVQISNLDINIVTRNLDNPYVQIKFLPVPVDSNSKLYKTVADPAQKVYATLRSYVLTKHEE